MKFLSTQDCSILKTINLSVPAHPASSLFILRAETKPDRSTSQDSSWTWHTWSFVKLCAVHLQQPRLVACGISLRSSGWLLVEYLYSQSVLISWTACKPCVPACLSLPDSTLYCLISNIPQTDDPRSTPQHSLNLTLSIKQFLLNIVLHCDIILTKHSKCETFYQGKTKLHSHHLQLHHLLPLSSWHVLASSALICIISHILLPPGLTVWDSH